MDELLKKFNLKYEDLNVAEVETLTGWLTAAQESNLTTDKVRDYIRAMKHAVEEELTKYDLGSKQDLFLKARLRNYILLDAFLTSPEIARKRLEAALGNIKGKSS